MARGDRLAFEAVWDRAGLVVEAYATPGQVTLLIDGHELEIQKDAFVDFVKRAVVAAHQA